MNLPTEILATLRCVMAAFPSLAFHTPSMEIEPGALFFPSTHGDALDPDRALVVGNRGMGKSFWASALRNPEHRSVIATRFPAAKRLRGNIDVHFGFAEGEGTVGVSKAELAAILDTQASPELIWRAIALGKLAERCGQALPASLSDRVDWARQHPTDMRELIRLTDKILEQQSAQVLFVFDQLEQLSDNPAHRDALIQGILRLALAFKSYRRIRVKIFMRPDYFARETLFAFPDASKVKSDKCTLEWRSTDLYGLLFHRLIQAARPEFQVLLEQLGVNVPLDATLQQRLVSDERLQHRIFDLIAGETMGATVKRARPYTWLLSHLADARHQVSPRTFMRALTCAASHLPAPTETVIDPLGIREGVRDASAHRIDDLSEDHPWVRLVLTALSSLLVPCPPEELTGLIKVSGRLPEILHTLSPEAPQPDDLREATQLEQLLKQLTILGLIERRETSGMVDVPDIFRIQAGIRRKGGITPQQRRLVRGF